MAKWKETTIALVLHPVLTIKAALGFAKGDAATGVAALQDIKAAEERETEAMRTAEFAQHVNNEIARNGWFVGPRHGAPGRFPSTPIRRNLTGDGWGFGDMPDAEQFGGRLIETLRAAGKDPWGFDV